MEYAICIFHSFQLMIKEPCNCGEWRINPLNNLRYWYCYHDQRIIDRPKELAVTSAYQVVFQGTYDECINWMRNNPNKWDDLRYTKFDKLWRCASYVL